MFIKWVPYNLRNYKLYLPNDILAKYNLSVKNLWDRVSGKPHADLNDAILELFYFIINLFSSYFFIIYKYSLIYYSIILFLLLGVQLKLKLIWKKLRNYMKNYLIRHFVHFYKVLKLSNFWKIYRNVILIFLIKQWTLIVIYNYLIDCLKLQG